jgi:hypothetical protein
VTVGDAFRITTGSAERIRINGSTDRLDDIGRLRAFHRGGGHAGGYAGGACRAARSPSGDAGPWLARK